MRIPKLASLALGAALITCLPAQRAEAQLSSLTGYAPVAFQYTCPAQTGTLPTCTTSFSLPANKMLVVQNVSGSATPIAPNAAGNFATGQASLTVTTQLSNEPAISNVIGPNYAIGNTAIWFYNTLTSLYTDTVPVVANNGGSVFVQGYIIFK